jgi:hypothetical protein
VACDVAQNSAESSQPVAPGTLIVRLASERQKLTSAVQSLASIFREALLRERLGLVRLCLQD